jgi:hypothetical protein
MVRDLLDAKGLHGQGDLFQKLFVPLIGIPLEVGQLPTATVTCEEPTSLIENSSRRIDITLNFGGQFGIGIENKPWAIEQSGWLRDYSSQLRKKFRDNFILVVLKPTERSLSDEDKEEREHLQSKKQFKIVSYEGELTNWLNSCYKECRAEKVRFFLKDFMEYARALGATKMVSEQDRKMASDYILGDLDNLRVAGIVWSAKPQIQELILAGFLNTLETTLKQRLGKGWTITNPGPEMAKRFVEFRIAKDTWADQRAVVLAPEGKSFYWGIRKSKDAPFADGGGVARELHASYPKGKSDAEWEWWVWVDEEFKDLDNVETLIKLQAKQEALSYFQDHLMRIIEIVDPILERAAVK